MYDKIFKLSKLQSDFLLKQCQEKIKKIQEDIECINKEEEELKNKKELLIIKKEEVNKLIFQLSPLKLIDKKTLKKHFHYEPSSKWIVKLSYFLSIECRCLSTEQIVDLIINHDPEYSKKNSRETIKGNVSSAISTEFSRRDSNKLKRYNSSRTYYIGFIEWFDENEDVLEEYISSICILKKLAETS